MAKARMIKADVRTSEKVASWSLDVRYFWVLLWGYVDDHGKAKDSPLLVKADCFPLDEDIVGATVDEWLWVLSDAGVIVRYENDGSNYLAVKNWAEHQKPQHPAESKIPDYTAKNSAIRTRSGVLMNDSCSTHEGCMTELSRDEIEIEYELTSDAEAPEDNFSSDVYELCELLGSLITANGNRVGTIGKTWHSAADRLIRLDGYTRDQVEQVLRWSQQSEFWQGNILSMSKLREKFDTLKGQMFAEQRRANTPRQSAAQKNLSTVAYFAELENGQPQIEGQLT